MKTYAFLLLFVISLTLAGCTRVIQQGETKTVVVQQSINELELEPVPGTVNDVWIEPMVSTIWVPGQIQGNYYRKGHTTIIEPRRKKFQKVQFPNYDGKYPPAPSSK